jgi:glucose-1-phosphate cytidylyltransferase
VFEQKPLKKLARGGELMAYRHGDFWICMDTLRDVRLLDGLWQENKAPWKVW